MSLAFSMVPTGISPSRVSGADICHVRSDGDIFNNDGNWVITDSYGIFDCMHSPGNGDMHSFNIFTNCDILEG